MDAVDRYVNWRIIKQKQQRQSRLIQRDLVFAAAIFHVFHFSFAFNLFVLDSKCQRNTTHFTVCRSIPFLCRENFIIIIGILNKQLNRLFFLIHSELIHKSVLIVWLIVIRIRCMHFVGLDSVMIIVNRVCQKRKLITFEYIEYDDE